MCDGEYMRCICLILQLAVQCGFQF